MVHLASLIDVLRETPGTIVPQPDLASLGALIDDARATGDALLSPGVTRRVIERFAHRHDPTSDARRRLAVLTARETEVVQLIALGLSNSEIATRLGISPLTAKTHSSRAIAKLNLRDRVQLVILAYESGLVRPGR
jgi:DNA-binding NarL/FixJ family response regulator